jgi:hypothetical protein
MRRVTAGPTSFEFQGPLRAHFGFGTTTVVDTVRVEWPSGIVQVLTDVATNQILPVFEPDPVSAPAPTSEGTAWLGPGSPNPFRGAVSFELRTDARTTPTLAVFDVSGRRLRTLVVAARGPGRQAVRWDGRDESGVPAAAGVYFVRAISGDAVGERRVVLLR